MERQRTTSGVTISLAIKEEEMRRQRRWEKTQSARYDYKYKDVSTGNLANLSIEKWYGKRSKNLS